MSEKDLVPELILEWGILCREQIAEAVVELGDGERPVQQQVCAEESGDEPLRVSDG
jgi:hypothetical protein